MLRVPCLFGWFLFSAAMPAPVATGESMVNYLEKCSSTLHVLHILYLLLYSTTLQRLGLPVVPRILCMCFMDVPDSLHGLQFYVHTRAVEVPSMAVCLFTVSIFVSLLVIWTQKNFMIASLACVQDQACLLLALRMVVIPEQWSETLCSSASNCSFNGNSINMRMKSRAQLRQYYCYNNLKCEKLYNSLA
jgi:hypothetical protein